MWEDIDPTEPNLHAPTHTVVLQPALRLTRTAIPTRAPRGDSCIGIEGFRIGRICSPARVYAEAAAKLHAKYAFRSIYLQGDLL